MVPGCSSGWGSASGCPMTKDWGSGWGCPMTNYWALAWMAETTAGVRRIAADAGESPVPDRHLERRSCLMARSTRR